MSLYLKATRKGRIPSYRGGQPIPYRTWTERVTDPVLCRSGWHACRWEDVPAHLSEELWVCELDGTVIEGDDKVVAERLRIVRKVNLSDRDLRLFAADCAEAALHHFEDRYPDDDRPRLAIQAARDYANGLISRTKLSAARSAAWSAADSAAWSAAWSAADSAAWSAARSAAWSAAWSAARSAADSAAWSAARSAQTDNLLVNYAHLDPADFAHRSST